MLSQHALSPDGVVDMSSVGATHGGSAYTVAWDMSTSTGPTSLLVRGAEVDLGSSERRASQHDRFEANSRLAPTSCSGASLPFVVRAHPNDQDAGRDRSGRSQPRVTRHGRPH
jgi:hypothetical protein